jgi:dTDP-4-amino-4,6-dideoxygalactose transaminase
VPKLLYKNDLKTAEKILKHYKSDWGAAHNFNLALILFKKEGPKSETAIKQLKKAIESNHHVPKFLTSKISLPKEIPDAYSHGSIEEAVIYMSTAVLTWVDAEGAIEWLHAYCGEQPKKRTKTKIKN